jgi:hypothetical protein
MKNIIPVLLVLAVSCSSPTTKAPAMKQMTPYSEGLAIFMDTAVGSYFIRKADGSITQIEDFSQFTLNHYYIIRFGPFSEGLCAFVLDGIKFQRVGFIDSSGCLFQKVSRRS